MNLEAITWSSEVGGWSLELLVGVRGIGLLDCQGMAKP